jgi:hypothetical protein
MVRDSKLGRKKHSASDTRRQGPVVRIGPNELHYADPNVYSEIYSARPVLPKEHDHYRVFMADHGLTGLVDVAIARKRRELMQVLFSKRTVMNVVEYTIQQKVDKFCDLLEQFCKTEGPFPVYNACRCLMTDIITEYALGSCWNLLDSAPVFYPPYNRSIDNFLLMYNLFTHAWWLQRILAMLPRPVINIVSPGSLGALDMHKVNTPP